VFISGGEKCGEKKRGGGIGDAGEEEGRVLIVGSGQCSGKERIIGEGEWERMGERFK